MSQEKKYDKVTIIGVAVSVAVLLYGAWFRPMQQMKKRAAEAPAQPVVQQQTAAQPAAPVQAAPAAVTPSATTNQLQAPRDIHVPWVRRDSQTVQLARTGEITADISADGTGCIRIELPKYKVDVVKSGDDTSSPNVELSHGDFPYMALIPPADHAALTEVIDRSSTETSFTLVRKTADGRMKVSETWSLKNAAQQAPYEMAYAVSVENLSGQPLELTGYRVEAGAMPPSVSRDRKASRGEFAGGASYATSPTKNQLFAMKNLVKMKDDEKARLAATPTLWTAVHSKYFMLSLWMEQGNFAGIECAEAPSVLVNGEAPKNDGRYHMRALLPTLSVPAGNTATWSMKGYAGPKDFERLCAYGTGLESVMDLDRFFFWRPLWMRYISRYLLKMLVCISGWFPPSIGYGMAVILLTLIVKIIFWPLAHKSTLSMRKMQLLKPQLDALKAKYKDDPTTMYRKQQELFKENNVSQLGGCLPMLLQIPVFFALFSTFRNAIELRHASFLWAYDLSMPDTLAFSALPIRPFAILMAASMYLQQRMTPNPDPQQAKMMSFMTIFFMFLFYGMPSALTLYLTVSYLLGILQTALTNKLLPPVTAVTAK